jgi:agmatinase
MKKKEKVSSFDPNGLGLKSNGPFGLPFDASESEVVVLPFPWEVTVSYGSGAANGPEAILEASHQVDLYDPDMRNAWQMGIYMDAPPSAWLERNRQLRPKVESYVAALSEGVSPQDPGLQAICLEVNEACEGFHNMVEEWSDSWLKQEKLVFGLGGDHSTPFGLMKALAQQHDDFGILQFDAHCDLRRAYEGFTWSHASVMYNVLERIPQVSRLVQVGIRDYCEEEAQYIQQSKGRVRTWFDRDIKRRLYQGQSMLSVHEAILADLPEKVFVSFDIDALDPSMCPNTGTPVPGGLSYWEAEHLLEMLARSGRTIVGMDLNEVAPGDDEWDANVGARLLYRMCNLFGLNRGRLPL